MEIVKLEEKSSLMPDFYQKHNVLLLLNFTHVSPRTSCSNEYDANSGIQNKTAKRSIIVRFLSVH